MGIVSVAQYAILQQSRSGKPTNAGMHAFAKDSMLSKTKQQAVEVNVKNSSKSGARKGAFSIEKFSIHRMLYFQKYELQTNSRTVV